MDDKKYDKLMTDWAAREEAAAPRLEPTDELRRLVAEKGGQSTARPITTVFRIAAIAAGLIVLVTIARFVLFPAPPPPFEDRLRLLAWQDQESVTFQGAVLMDKEGGKGPGKGDARGPKKGRRTAFSQLLLQHHRRGSSVVNGTDLLIPAPENSPEKPLLASGDLYRLGLKLSADRYVYIFQLASGGFAEQLFPNTIYSSVANPIRREQGCYLPAEPNWFTLSVTEGEERIIIVASHQPLPELDVLYSCCDRAQSVGARRQSATQLRHALEALWRDHPEGVEVVLFAFNGP